MVKNRYGRGFFIESQRVLSSDVADWSFLRYVPYYVRLKNQTNKQTNKQKRVIL
jgi:hypothetical protein